VTGSAIVLGLASIGAETVLKESTRKWSASVRYPPVSIHAPNSTNKSAN